MTVIVIESYNSTPKCEHDVRALVWHFFLEQSVLAHELRVRGAIAIPCPNCGELAYMLRREVDDAGDLQR